MKNGQSRSSCSLEIPVTGFIEKSRGLSFALDFRFILLCNECTTISGTMNNEQHLCIKYVYVITIYSVSVCNSEGLIF